MRTIVQKLKQIKYQCAKHRETGCTNCIFYDKDSRLFPCNAQMAINTLYINNIPSEWDIEEVAYLLYGEE